MFIESKNGLNAISIYQGKACAICKTQFFVIKTPENVLCILLHFIRDPENNNIAIRYLIHEFDGCPVTASRFEKGIDFVHDVIGGIYFSPVFLESFVKRFCFSVVLIPRDC